MEKIIPRWEWRTFSHDLTQYRETLQKYGEPSVKKSNEIYILSKVRDDNTKIRFDLIDVKSLQTVNEEKLEQWSPTLKTGFPIHTDQLHLLFATFGVNPPAFSRQEYSYDQFIEELIKPNQQLQLVDVKKLRYIYTVNDCAVEYAETEFNGVPYQTACVEHIDPELVIRTVKELGLYTLPNINYIMAMKKSVGLL